MPEIADYEVRRELLRAGKAASVMRLDAFVVAEPDHHLPLTTQDVRLAAQLWAQARRIVARHFGLSGVLVATQNTRHFANLAPAALWSDVKP